MMAGQQHQGCGPHRASSSQPRSRQLNTRLRLSSSVARSDNVRVGADPSGRGRHRHYRHSCAEKKSTAGAAWLGSVLPPPNPTRAGSGCGCGCGWGLSRSLAFLPAIKERSRSNAFLFPFLVAWQQCLHCSSTALCWQRPRSRHAAGGVRTCGCRREEGLIWSWQATHLRGRELAPKRKRTASRERTERGSGSRPLAGPTPSSISLCSDPRPIKAREKVRST